MWTSSSSPADIALPGTYLLRTRIGGPRALVSYVWLEFAPLAAAAATVSLQAAVGVLLAHWVFLGVYEAGYVFNDRASTASENSEGERPRYSVTGGAAALFVAVRVAALALACAWLGPALGLLSIAAVVLLVLHTRVGEAWPARDPRRWITFGWLAAFKYMPAAVTFLSPRDACELCALLFLSYGGGRVLQYAQSKSGATPSSGVVDAAAAWYLATLPLAAVLAWGRAPWVAALSVLAAHHLAATAFRLAQKSR